MAAYTRLEPYELSQDLADLLQKCFAEPPAGTLYVFPSRPEPSDLRNQIQVNLCWGRKGFLQPPGVMELAYRTVRGSWDRFYEESVAPNDFMKTPIGALYAVCIGAKGRGLVASRDIKAKTVILKESPVIVLPADVPMFPLFLALPRNALEAILLLHNQNPDLKDFSTGKSKECIPICCLDLAEESVPVRCLVDLLKGIYHTNSYGEGTDDGNIRILLLVGSMFNHAKEPNVTRAWNDRLEIMVFTSLRNIKAGEELEIDYVPGVVGEDRVERLKAYGITEEIEESEDEVCVDISQPVQPGVEMDLG